MTWEAKDTQRQQRGASDMPHVRPADSEQPSPVPESPDMGPPLGELSLSWGEEETETETWLLSSDVGRALAAQGMVSDRDWRLWSRMMRRGVTEI